MDLKIALCTIYNDDILDIKEWVEWNKNIGISKIFIYENNINNKKYESIKDYISGCFVEIINIKSINNEINDLKSNCFIDFYEGQGKDYDWICFLDINDFLMFNDNLDLFSFLNKKEFINQDLILVSLENHNHFVKSIVRSDRQILDKSQNNLSSVFRLENDNTIYSAGLRLRDKRNHYDIPNRIHRLASCYIDNRYHNEIKENELKVDLYTISSQNKKNIIDGNTNKTTTNINNLQNYKKVIYTCITGNYDNLLEPEYISPDYDYICFTDDKKLQSNTWKIKYIPDNLLNLSKVKQQRNIKINTHKYLPEYDLSIWVDSSVKLSNNINNVLCSLDFNNYNIFISKHPQRNCIYKEAEACIDLKKDNKYIIETELKYFKSEGMPENFGLLETNVIIKLHNDPKCIELMELWSKYLNIFSHRDQISLPFVLWKLKYDKLCYLPIGFNRSTYFYWIGGLHKKINICIIHYNTPELTNALIKSINKHVKRAYIYLFDNSDKNPFTYKYDNLEYLNNTNGQYINFNKWLDNYPTRFQTREHIGNYGSARHSISIQKCMEIIDDNFILMDSDILLKRDISGFINHKYIYVGETEKQGNGKYRVLPFCLFINVKMCKKYNVPWFDANYMHGLHLTKEADKYDTGGAFYIHTRNYPYKDITLKSFIIHYKGGSWEEKYMKEHNLTLTSKEWLEINKKYWQ